MPFCPKCGNEYQGDTKFCVKCGENLESTGASDTAAEEGAQTKVNLEKTVSQEQTVPQDAQTISEPAAASSAAPNTAAANTNTNTNQGQGFFQKLMNTKDSTASMDANDIASSKVMAILAYCGVFAYILFAWFGQSLLGLIAAAGLLIAPCLSAKKSPFIQFHLSRLAAAFFGVLLVGIIEGAISGFIFRLIYSVTFYSVMGMVLGTILSWLIHLVFFAVPVFILIVGFINVIKGQAKDLPVIGKFRFIFEK